MKMYWSLFPMKDNKTIFDMSPDEAYEDFLKFCKENDMKPATREDFLYFNKLWDEMVPAEPEE